MTKLELQLAPKTFVWSLVNPSDPKKFLKQTNEPGYAAIGLILSQQTPGPVEVVYEDLPTWAQKQVQTAIRSGQIINTGDKIESPAEPVTTEKAAKDSETKTSSKKGSSKRNSASTQKQSA